MTDQPTLQRAKKNAIVLAALFPVLAGYSFLGHILNVAPLYAGFFFLYYWGAIKHTALDEWLPCLLGALAGLALSGLYFWLGKQYGASGAVVGIILIAAILYCCLMNWLPLVLNGAFTLLLTLGTVSVVAAQNYFLQMAEAVLLAAFYFGGIVLLVARLGKPTS